jgi:hypothetical protein
LGELEEIEKAEEEQDIRDQMTILQKELDELRKQNTILSISN